VPVDYVAEGCNRNDARSYAEIISVTCATIWSNPRSSTRGSSSMSNIIDAQGLIALSGQINLQWHKARESEVPKISQN
jgi:hypothetical protein